MAGVVRQALRAVLLTMLATVAISLPAMEVGAQDPTGTITGVVDRGFPINAPAEGVVVDRFEANADGTRGTYLDSATTDNDGTYTFTVAPGAYILTFIAPDGENFNSTGTPWANAPATVTAGETTTINQTLDGGITLVDAVDDTYEFTAGVFADVDLTTNDTAVTRVGSVNYVFGSGDLPPGMNIQFPPVGGVYQTLQGTPTTPGTYNFQYQLSNDNGDTDTANVTVTVTPDVGTTGTISGTVDRGFPINAPAEGVVVDRFEANADGTRGTYLDSATTDNDGLYSFSVDPGVYILTFIAPDGENFNSTGSPWANVPVTVVAGETTTANQTLDGGIILVDAVDDTYDINVGDTVNLDLTSNDTAVTRVGSVDYVFGSGDLPPGLEIRFPDVGGVYQTLQGTATTAGTYNFQYRLSNENGDTDTANVTVTVTAEPEVHPDIVQVISVPGRNPRGASWADSYSVGSQCYCASTFDHGIGDVEVDTPAGRLTVREICSKIGDGPGAQDRPIYNDIQCGNGPANTASDETDCPGRVDIGRAGCGHIGPTWDLSVLGAGGAPPSASARG